MNYHMNHHNEYDDEGAVKMKYEQTVNGRIGIFYLIAFLGLLASLLLLLRPLTATADNLDLPPRETPGVEVEAEEPEVIINGLGARVHLQAHFSQDWPWEAMHWQEDLWIVVQWLDEEGVWQDVAGWQGTLDAIQQVEDWQGVKELWLADVHLGTGPYRWQVFERDNGRLLSTSDEFYLPNKGGDLLTLEMMLKP